MAEAEENVAGEKLSVAVEVSEKKKATKPAPARASATKTDSKGGYWWGTGRRKSSIARVRIKPGEGKILINKKELGNYFAREQDRNAVMAPLQAVNAAKSFDVFINVKGGGTTGQSGAVRLGIARALRNYDKALVHSLREGGHLTRDARMVERKKPGRAGARRRFQFSKR